MKLSAELAREYYLANYGHLAAEVIDKAITENLNADRAAEALSQVERYVPFPLAGHRLLEIGSGVGMVVRVARQRGIDAYGLEPSEIGSAAANANLTEHGQPATVSCAVGEQLPYPDAHFDVVCSFQVMEHTRSPEAVLSETIRVLKPGGYFVHVFPNYGSLWEGHYGVPWIPHLPKALGFLYVRLLGRDRAMMEELQLLSHQSVARMLRKHSEIEVVSWGVDLFEQRLRTLEFSEWAYLGRVKRLARLAHRLRLVEPFIALSRLIHLETPIVLVGRKR